MRSRTAFPIVVPIGLWGLLILPTAFAQIPDLELRWPVHGADRSAVTQDYGQYNLVQANRYHVGLDISAPTNTLVRAAAAGWVIKIQENGGSVDGVNPCIIPPKPPPVIPSNCGDHGYGNTVIIEHRLANGKVYSHYSHLAFIEDRLKTACGPANSLRRRICSSPVPITVGAILGGVGGTCFGQHCTSPHLHFEIKNFSTLGTGGGINSDDHGLYGYTNSHPDQERYHDPMLNLHGIKPFPSRPLVRITHTPVSLQVGPGGKKSTAYRVITSPLSQTEDYEALKQSSEDKDFTALACPSEVWYQIKRKNILLFDDTYYGVQINGQVKASDGWVCADFLVSQPGKFQSLALIGQPAPGGGTIANTGYLYKMNNLGEIAFSAEIDLNGDGVPDETRTLKFSGGQIYNVAIPGIAKVGAVMMNDCGDLAFGDASVPGLTQAIYFLKAGSASPIKIAEEGQSSPVSGTTYHDLRGPLALNNNGDLAFSTTLFRPSTNTYLCCYLFLYTNSDGLVAKVAGSGEGTPVGGTFNIFVPATQITTDGAVVFEAAVNGGSAPAGIFLSSKTLGLSKVVAQGDPTPIGGRYESPGPFMRIHSVSGQRLVFQANVSGGASLQAIFVKDNVQSNTLADIKAIVSAGQPTGTEVGGKFAHPNYPSTPTTFSTLAGPQIRDDGGVIFQSLLQGATVGVGGVPTQRGIFLWTGREFRKVVVQGEHLPSAQTAQAASWFLSNDLGQIVF